MVIWAMGMVDGLRYLNKLNQLNGRRGIDDSKYPPWSMFDVHQVIDCLQLIRLQQLYEDLF